MPRPRCCRRVQGEPVDTMFKPAGLRGQELEKVIMTLDEFEALRLSDLEGLYQEGAAARMGVSRATFGRILEAAHKKVALALIEGKALVIEGGPVRVIGRRGEGGAGGPHRAKNRSKHQPRRVKKGVSK